MKLIIFGASGSIGRQLVLQSLSQGHEVTAFVRNTSKLADINHPNLRVTEGDVFNNASVTAAISGQEIVLCSLGGGRKGTVRSEGTKNIIKAMEQAGVKRLICQTTLGCGESWHNLNFFWKRIMFGWFIKGVLQDHDLQEQYVKRSTLDWTIVRPAAFTNGKVTGEYKHGFPPSDKSITLKISRADVALFMLQQINNVHYLKMTPGLSY